MKVTAKIFILVLSIALAIGGVMVYAKTRVEPPVAFQPINQFEKDLNHLYSDLKKAGAAREEDMIYLKAIDRISVFEKENRLTQAESDKHRDKLIDGYSPIFLKRCFSAFDKSVWKDLDHDYMLIVSKRLHSVKHSDGSKVLNKTTIDSLALVENIISNYRQAENISRSTTYRSVSSAQNTINQAQKYANDTYISKYENTLVPQVDATVTEYDNKANALYGSKKDVNVLWNKARGYYNEASNYYNNNNY